MRPIDACHSVTPSAVRRAIRLPAMSPVNVTPDSVVSTPAAPAPSPISWFHLIAPVR